MAPVGLNIKNERTHALVRDLAARTGQSQTSAVEEAVRRRLEEIEHSETGTVGARRVEVEALLRDIHRDLSDEDRAAFRSAQRDLYDEAGLPR